MAKHTLAHWKCLGKRIAETLQFSFNSQPNGYSSMSNLNVKQEYDAWNPGLTSDIPSDLMPQVTLFAPENSTVDNVAAKNASTFCDMKTHELAAFTVSRLVVHETLIRVFSDLFVPDGPYYEDLGISMHDMIKTIIDGYINPNLEHLELALDKIRQDITNCLKEMLERDLYPPSRNGSTKPSSFFARLFGIKKKSKTVRTPSDYEVLAAWQRKLSDELPPLENPVWNGCARLSVEYWVCETGCQAIGKRLLNWRRTGYAIPTAVRKLAN